MIAVALVPKKGLGGFAAKLGFVPLMGTLRDQVLVHMMSDAETVIVELCRVWAKEHRRRVWEKHLAISNASDGMAERRAASVYGHVRRWRSRLRGALGPKTLLRLLVRPSFVDERSTFVSNTEDSGLRWVTRR